MDRTQHNLGIVSYITVIGWLISYIMLEKNRGSFLVFHLRQSIGLQLMMGLNTLVILRFSPWIYSALSIGLFILWLIGFVGAMKGEYKKIPIIGDDLQRWFNFIQ